MLGLSTSSQRTLTEIQHPQADFAMRDDESNWEDIQDPNILMDSDMTLTAEGDEVEVLRELSGMCVFFTCTASLNTNMGISPRCRRDHRTWSQRIRTRDLKWAEQLDALADAYLSWKANSFDVEHSDETFTVEYIDVYGKNVAVLVVFL